jgi:hypothetical protein
VQKLTHKYASDLRRKKKKKKTANCQSINDMKEIRTVWEEKNKGSFFTEMVVIPTLLCRPENLN